jgi:hypothetical protein
MEGWVILYHGTAAQRVESIRKNGLLPRDKCGVASNYDGDKESLSSLVYLTSHFPVLYGTIAAERLNDPQLAIIQVDVDEDDLMPDEDFLRVRGAECPEEPWLYTMHADQSLSTHGTVTIDKVEPGQIIDVVHLPADDVMMLGHFGLEVANTVACGYGLPVTIFDKHRRAIERLFELNGDYRKTMAEILEARRREFEFLIKAK